MQAHFFNVDLEIRSPSKLDGLAAQMGKRVLVHHCGPAPKRHLLAVSSSRLCKSPDAAIHALCRIVESLPAAARRIWNRAHRTFDIGYGLRPAERSSHFALRADTLERITKLGATLAVTYYREDTNDA